MSKRPSASFNDPGYFYNQRRLLRLFAFSSAALMIGILLTIWQDFDRPWKDEQRAENRFEAAKFALEKMVLETQTVEARKELSRLRDVARKQLDEHKQALAEVRVRLNGARGAFYDADMRYKEQKQYTGQAEYEANEAKNGEQRRKWLRRLREERDKEHRDRDAAQRASDKLKLLLERESELMDAMDAVVAAERANTKLKRMKILAAGIEKKKSYNLLREAPLLDFLAPPTKVEQVVLDNLVDNYEFATPKKVDRCGTCHTGAMRVGFEKEKWPIEILDEDYVADPGNPASSKQRVFEEAVYRFVFGLMESVWPKIDASSKYPREDQRLRSVKIHHQVLRILFAEYDDEDGEIALVEEKGSRQGRKVWRRWRYDEAKQQWVEAQDGTSIAEYYLALLKRMKMQWRTHPHMADMVGDASPHPYETFGCTSCHNGRGWSVDFGFAYHMVDRKRIDDWMTSEWAREHGHHDPASARVSLEEAMAEGNTGGELTTGWVLDHEQGHAWEEERGWTHEKTHYWLWPQHPLSLVQSSCLKCHKEGLYATPEPEYADVRLGKPDVDAPDILDWEDHARRFNDDIEADLAGEYAGRIFLPEQSKPYRPQNLERGMDNFLRFGCYGCHKLDIKLYPFMQNVRPKVGPPLDELASKTTRAFLQKWVKNPKDFRKDTRMPRFWGLSNNSHDFRYRFAKVGHAGIDGEEWNDVEVYAIVEWLWAESRKRARSFPRIDLSKGDAARGARIVVGDHEASKGEAKACIACHVVPVPRDLEVDAGLMQAWEDRESRTSGGWKERMSRRQGPDLAGIGSKVDPNWLYAWLKDPRGYWHDTNMPNLRLTDQEALDVAAYLMTLRHAAFDALPGVGRNDLTMKRMAQELKVAEQSESTRRALSIVARWTDEQRTLYVGRKLVKHHGCFGCHEIDRYKDATPIGTELTEWGSKLIDRLEFNHAPIDRTRFDFAYTKLINPRIYDRGMARADRPLERLRMPRFVFTPQEARDLATFLVGLVNDPIPEMSLFRPDARQSEILRGRQVVRRYNCQGCHRIEGKGGDIWPVIGKVSWRPPDLLGQGRKTNPAWLFRFMKDPVFVLEYSPAGEDRVRPWHSIRMPSFGLTDEEARAVVRYFAALSKITPDFESSAGDSLAQLGEGYPKTFALKDKKDPEGKRKIELTARNRLEEAEAMFAEYACKSCHSNDPDVPVANRAPNFRHTRNGRLREPWIETWMWGPFKLQTGTKMPTFFGRESPKPQDKRFFMADPKNPDSRAARDATASEQIRVLRDYIRHHYEDE